MPVVARQDKNPELMSNKEQPTPEDVSSWHERFSLGCGELLPAGVRYIGLNTMVFVRPPGTKLIEYYNGNKLTASSIPYKNKSIYEITFPWTVYIVRFRIYSYSCMTQVLVGFSREDVSSKTSTIYYVPLPNLLMGDVNTPPSVCPSNSVNTVTNDFFESSLEKCQELISAVWESGWNNNANGAIHSRFLKHAGMNRWGEFLSDLDGKPLAYSEQKLLDNIVVRKNTLENIIHQLDNNKIGVGLYSGSFLRSMKISGVLYPALQ